MRKRKVEVRDYAVVCVLSSLNFHRFSLTMSPLSHILGSSLRIYEPVYKEHQWLSTHSARIARSLTIYKHTHTYYQKHYLVGSNFSHLVFIFFSTTSRCFLRKIKYKISTISSVIYWSMKQNHNTRCTRFGRRHDHHQKVLFICK